VVTQSLIQELRTIEGARLWTNAPLTPFTTIGTGGRADLLVTVSTPSALALVLAAVDGAAVPWLSLGAGSNLLVADQGYSGVLVKLDEAFQYLEGLPDRAGGRPAGEEMGLTAGAGAYLARLSAVVAEAGLSGLEFSCGIPGSVGGGVAMNAGAHGCSMADVVEAVELVSASGTSWVSAEALEWSYRSCGIPQGSVVTAARLRLVSGDTESILQSQRALLRTRRQTQPRGTRTFGSVFKNPPGDTAGRLLDVAGLKGVHRGGAEVSTIHANFVVNVGDATTADVLALMGLMRQGVHRMSGILLEPEVKLLGAPFPWESPSRELSAEPSDPNG
jgi:UDP-N-acetylmuramate dehydrogenase